MAIECMYVFTGNEVVATDLPAKLNENFAKTANFGVSAIAEIIWFLNSNMLFVEIKSPFLV